MKAPQISVIICTHNPREDYLARVLEALKAQTLPKEQWELLLIDNASKETLAGKWNLSWHPRARHVREEELGLTPARLRGIKESVGEVLVFVDDDNVLHEDYLETACTLASKYPDVEVWGPGLIKIEWEDGTPTGAKSFGGMFQEKSLLHTEYGCVVGTPHFTPPGTGLVACRAVIADYAARVGDGKLTARDRTGNQLSSAGDSQIVYSAVRRGKCFGSSPRLKAVHLIAKRRTTVRYMSRLAFNVPTSGYVALAEAFPEVADGWRRAQPGAFRILANMSFMSAKHLLRGRFRHLVIGCAAYLGELNGQALAGRSKQAVPLRLGSWLWGG